MIVEIELERDIDWRLEELACLRLMVAAAQKGSVHETASLRALWTMLYAHYEGFCKFALDVYLDYLERQNVVRSALRRKIAALSLEASFKTLRGDLSRDHILSFFSADLPAAMSAAAAFAVKLETQSNLWPNLLKSHCDTVHLTVPSIDSEFAKLRTLVARRNDIAHGKKNVIQSLTEYSKYEQAATAVMYELALAIAESVAGKTYLATLASP